MDTNEMLQRIVQLSDNENCRQTASRILTGESTIEEELKYVGSFMRAVLKGDHAEAVRRADSGNKRALTA